jgi:hypothetical protein
LETLVKIVGHAFIFKTKTLQGTILALCALPLARPSKAQQPFQVHCIPQTPTEGKIYIRYSYRSAEEENNCSNY